MTLRRSAVFGCYTAFDVGNGKRSEYTYVATEPCDVLHISAIDLVDAFEDVPVVLDLIARCFVSPAVQHGPAVDLYSSASVRTERLGYKGEGSLFDRASKVDSNSCARFGRAYEKQDPSEEKWRIARRVGNKRTLSGHDKLSGTEQRRRTNLRRIARVVRSASRDTISTTTPSTHPYNYQGVIGVAFEVVTRSRIDCALEAPSLLTQLLCRQPPPEAIHAPPPPLPPSLSLSLRNTHSILHGFFYYKQSRITIGRLRTTAQRLLTSNLSLSHTGGRFLPVSF